MQEGNKYAKLHLFFISEADATNVFGTLRKKSLIVLNKIQQKNKIH